MASAVVCGSVKAHCQRSISHKGNEPGGRGGPSGSSRGTLEARCREVGWSACLQQAGGQCPILSKIGLFARSSPRPDRGYRPLQDGTQGSRSSPRPASALERSPTFGVALSSLVAPSRLYAPPQRRRFRLGVSLSETDTKHDRCQSRSARTEKRSSRRKRCRVRSLRNWLLRGRRRPSADRPRKLKLFPENRPLFFVRATKATAGRSPQLSLVDRSEKASSPLFEPDRPASTASRQILGRLACRRTLLRRSEAAPCRVPRMVLPERSRGTRSTALASPSPQRREPSPARPRRSSASPKQ